MSAYLVPTHGVTDLARRLLALIPEQVRNAAKRILLVPAGIVVRGSTLARYKPGQRQLICPICGSGDVTPLREVPVTRHFMLYDHRPWARCLVRAFRLNRFVEQVGSGRWSVRYVKCLTCQNGFQDFPHTHKSIEGYYTGFYRSGRFQYRGDAHRRGKERLAQFFLDITQLAPGTRILDIGCAEGLVCRYLADREYDVFGVEPFSPMARFATNELGLSNIMNDHYRLGLFPEAYFDGIFVSHVLEHVFGVKDFLQAVHQHLKPGGLLMLEVPALETPVDTFNTDHFTVWSRTGMEQVLTVYGFEVIEFFSASSNDAQPEAQVAVQAISNPLRAGAMCLVARRRS